MGARYMSSLGTAAATALQNNQFAQGGLTLMAVGLAAAALRNIATWATEVRAARPCAAQERAESAFSPEPRAALSNQCGVMLL